MDQPVGGLTGEGMAGGGGWAHGRGFRIEPTVSGSQIPRGMEVPVQRLAVIDVGTNSVKVLVGDVVAGVVTPVWEASEQTRLGRGFYDDRRLRPEPMAATARAVARFAEEARNRLAAPVRVVGTSAVRDAVNQGELLEAVRHLSGLDLEVVSGEREAEWGFRGVTSAPELRKDDLLVLDVGGGSTEFILGTGARIHHRQSFPLGSVRLLERFQPADPPDPSDLHRVRRWIGEFLAREVIPGLRESWAQNGMPGLAVGVGGTTAILALIHHRLPVFDRDVVESTVFTRGEVRALNEGLWMRSLVERRRLPGLPPERADVMLTGAAIYEGILESLGLDRLAASTRGLRYGALLEEARRRELRCG